MKVDERFSKYLSLGDSMSMDCYPADDQRCPDCSGREVGAASLFFKNQDVIWPEFSGQDLRAMFDNIQFSNHTFDGATIANLLEPERLAELEPFRDERMLVTLTVGGNDLLAAFQKNHSHESGLEEQFDQLQQNFAKLLNTLQEKLRGAFFLVSNLYDPTDGGGLLPENSHHEKFPVSYLHRFNEVASSAISQMHDAVLCDVHKHFLGHGTSAGDDMWYLLSSPIEPGARGASELRRVWLSSLEKKIKLE